jgi:hypothetical protein
MIRQNSFAAIAGLFLTLASAAQAEITFTGGDGSTPARAIIIEGAAGSSDGVASEYDWVAANRPGARVVGQALVQDGDKVYDLLTVQSGDRTEEIYFDITGFFGNF